jgi:hypothetical protein
MSSPQLIQGSLKIKICRSPFKLNKVKQPSIMRCKRQREQKARLNLKCEATVMERATRKFKVSQGLQRESNQEDLWPRQRQEHRQNDVTEKKTVNGVEQTIGPGSSIPAASGTTRERHRKRTPYNNNICDRPSGLRELEHLAEPFKSWKSGG